MSEASEILVIARDWVQKAEIDLKNAKYTLGMKEDCPTIPLTPYAFTLNNV